jgi:hypothetical protein
MEERSEPPTVYLTVAASSTGENPRATSALPGPGGVFRFAVGEPGRRSGVWRLWAGKAKGDVYFAGRSIAGVQKFSLHESGDWRQQWVNEAQAMKYGGTDDRIVDQWPRPAAIDADWTRGLTVRFLRGELSEVDDSSMKPGEVTWIPEPEQGYAFAVIIFVVTPNGGYFRIPAGVMPITGFSLATGQAVFVVGVRQELPDEVRARLDAARSEGLSITDPMVFEHEERDGRRLTIHGHDELGNRILWDLAARAPGIDA